MKLALFVDVHNLFYSVKLHLQGKIDYAKLLRMVVDSRDLVCANAYVLRHPDIDQRGFLAALELAGFSVKANAPSDARPTLSDPSHYGRMFVDIGEVGRKADIICVGTGNFVFAPLLKGFNYYGKQTEVVGVKRAIHHDLAAAADKIIEIDKNCLLSGVSSAVSDQRPKPAEKSRPVVLGLGSTAAGKVDTSALPQD
jgi:uncharacterized LabA/DUF88 family protein